MRKAGVILTVLFLFSAGSYLFVRYYLLRAPDYPADLSKARSALDLRPALIARLQQAVKDGSKGLYTLTLDSIDVNLGEGTVGLVNARVRVDSLALASLEAERAAPDDVYEIRFHKLVIRGLGPGELIRRRDIRLSHISLVEPEVLRLRKERRYNEMKRKSSDTSSLYDRIAKHFSQIVVDSIEITHGRFITRDLLAKNKDERIDGISVSLRGLNIDPAAGRNDSRFLFSDDARISCGRLQRRTADSLYLLQADSLLLDAAARRLTVFRFALIPRGDRAFFRRKLVYRGDRFDIRARRIVLDRLHILNLLEKGAIECSTLTIDGGQLKDFVDGSMPPKPGRKWRNFPYQALRQLTIPVIIPRAYVRNFDIAYTEYNPKSRRNGTLYFDGVRATVTNLINAPAAIAPGAWCTVEANTNFMHRIPGKVQMRFNMNSYHNGIYTARVRMGTFDAQILNPVTENLGLFSVKRGVVDSFVADIKGDNARTGATVKLLYHDLHISTLKNKDPDGAELRKKPLVNLFMNTFLIKNNNPGANNRPRITVSSIERGTSPSFFNFSWKALRYCILKTVGIPESFIPE